MERPPPATTAAVVASFSTAYASARTARCSVTRYSGDG